MSRVLDIWRSWTIRKRIAVVSIAFLVAAGGVALAAYLVLRRPGDVSNPNAKFVKRRPPHPKPNAKVKLTNWPEYGLNDQRTRYLPTSKVHPPFHHGWDFHSPSLLEFSPVSVDGHLYVITKAGVMYGLKAKDGKERWKRDVGTLSASSPAYHRGRVFAVTLGPGQVAAMRARDGKVMWRHLLPGRSESSPLVHGGRVFVGCESGDVFAYDEKTGKLDWSFHSGGAVKGGVAYDHGAIFFGNYAGQVYALDSSTGKVHWQAQTIGGGFLRGGGIYSTPAIAFDRVYFGGLDGRVYSYVESSGELAWSQTLSAGNEVYASPAVAFGQGVPPSVYVGSTDHHLYVLNARSGEMRWVRDVKGPVLGAASVIGRDVYVSTIGPNVGTFGFRTSDGDEQFYSDLGEYNPAISDGRHLFLTGSAHGINRVTELTPRPPHLKKKRAKARKQKQAKGHRAKEKGHAAKGHQAHRNEAHHHRHEPGAHHHHQHQQHDHHANRHG
jgi:outer membrane protein assembly factor BamB